MSFPLSKIELHLEDDLLAQAELLLQNGALQEAKESIPNLWVALAKRVDEKLEVEVLLKKGQVKEHTCECGQSSKNTYCVHVVALLLKILALSKQQKEKEKTIVQKEVKIPKRITLSYVLDLVEPKDLKQFIQDYASQDRHFGLLVKAHFAHLLPRTEDNEPIGQALSNAIKAIKKPGKSMSKNDLKMLQKILDSLLQQAEDALYKKHYADVFETVEALLLQLSPLLLMLTNKKIFKDAIVKTLLLVEELNKVMLAPELESEIWELCLAEAHKQVYYFNDLWSELGHLLLSMANTKSRSATLLTLFEEKSEDNFVKKNEMISAGLVNFKIQLFELQHNEAALNRYLAENINHPEVLKQSILIAAQSENWIQLEQLTTFALQSTTNGEEQIYLKDQLLNSYLPRKKKKEIRQLAKELFLKTFDPRYFQILKKATGKKWLDHRSTLLIELDELPNTVSKMKIKAQLFAEENLTVSLRKHLQESLSLDLLQQYDGILFQQHHKNTVLLYREVMDSYLENYLGLPAAVKIRESLNHLMAINQKETATFLMAFIKEKYGDRGSIRSELSEL